MQVQPERTPAHWQAPLDMLCRWRFSYMLHPALLLNPLAKAAGPRVNTCCMTSLLQQLPQECHTAVLVQTQPCSALEQIQMHLSRMQPLHTHMHPHAPPHTHTCARPKTPARHPPLLTCHLAEADVPHPLDVLRLGLEAPELMNKVGVQGCCVTQDREQGQVSGRTDTTGRIRLCCRPAFEKEGATLLLARSAGMGPAGMGPSEREGAPHHLGRISDG